MSANFEAPLIVAQTEQQTERATGLHLQEYVGTAKRLLGRGALVLAVALGPGAVMGVGESLLTATPAAADAINDYPDADAKLLDAANDDWWKDKNHDGVFEQGEQNSSRSYAYRNCTDWVAWRIPELDGVSVPAGIGDAKNWDTDGPSPWSTGTVPKVGDIAESEYGQWGHVGVVEAIKKDANGTITEIEVSQYNAGNDGAYSAPWVANSGGTYWRDSAHTRKWDHFIDPGGTPSGGGDTPTAPDIDGDGVADADDTCPIKPGLASNHGCPVQHVYSGMNDGRVLETYWGGGNALTTWQAANVSEPVTAVTDQFVGSVEHIYFGTQSGALWDVYWGDGNALTQWKMADLGSPIDSIASQITPDGTQHIYTGTDSGVIRETYLGPSDRLTTYTMTSTSSPVESLSSQLTTNSVGIVQHVFSGAADGKLRETYVGGGNALTTAVMANEAAPIAGIDSAIDGSANTHIFSSTTTGKSYDTYWGPKASLTNAQMANLSRTVTSMAARYVKDVWHIYNGGADGNIWDTYWGGGNSLTTAPLYNMGYAVTKLSAEAEVNGTQHIYTVTESGKQQETYLGGGNSLTSWQIANLGSGINAIASDIK